jgi:hypothetical protein
MTTNCLYTAAFLQTRGHPLTLKRLPSSRCEFVFGDAARPDVAAYESGAPISAASYAETLRRLKRLMMNPSNASITSPSEAPSNVRFQRQ